MAMADPILWGKRVSIRMMIGCQEQGMKVLINKYCKGSGDMLKILSGGAVGSFADPSFGQFDRCQFIVGHHVRLLGLERSKEPRYFTSDYGFIEISDPTAWHARAQDKKARFCWGLKVSLHQLLNRLTS